MSYRNTKLVVNTKDIKKMEWEMEGENSVIMMEGIMRGIGKMIKWMGKENYIMLLEN